MTIRIGHAFSGSDNDSDQPSLSFIIIIIFHIYTHKTIKNNTIVFRVSSSSYSSSSSTYYFASSSSSHFFLWFFSLFFYATMETCAFFIIEYCACLPSLLDFHATDLDCDYYNCQDACRD